tara:strand:+ start:317 stop:460 length:144 start_codon:yes stop_codon:yes gene_type:complete
MNGVEYLYATIIRPWTIVIIFFILLIVFLVDWGSKKVDKFLKGDDDE